MKRTVVETLKEKENNFSADVIIEDNRIRLIVLKHSYMGTTDSMCIHPFEVEDFFYIIKFIKESSNVQTLK